MATAGLKVHLGKTNILSNDPDNNGGTLKLSTGVVDIIPYSGSAVYLGKTLSLGQLHGAEVEARVSKAWRKFFTLKADLCGKHASLKSRLKLFNATVTPTVLYGSGSWTMTADGEKLLRTIQRRMLRWMLGSFWKPPVDQEDTTESETDSDSEYDEPSEVEDSEAHKLEEES